MRLPLLGAAICTTLLATLLATPLAAQNERTFEVGGFGQYTHFSNPLNLDDKVGIGGLVGFFVMPGIALEADGSYTKSKDQSGTVVQDAKYQSYHARLVLDLPVAERASALVGIGGALVHLSDGLGATEGGGHALLGVRFRVIRAVSLRLTGTADWLPNLGPGSASAWNLGAQAGVSLLFGGAGGGPNPSGDDDRDGVVNSVDRCPGTQPGEVVDGNGCPKRKDSDGDGVIDINDDCPSTPPGTKVDANGCPLAAPTQPKTM